MKKYIGGNIDCFTCGGAKPLDVTDRADMSWYSDFRCPDCRARIVAGYQHTNGQVTPDGTGPERIPPWIHEDAKQISSRANWETWEVWWAPNGSFVAAVNGRVTYGDAKLLDAVEYIQSEV